MKSLYNVSVFLIWAGIKIASLISPKAKLWCKGRKNWHKRLDTNLSKNERWVWIHCSSMGEFEDGREFIEGFKNEYPQYKILLTFFSPSGFEVHKSNNSADLIVYMPIDFNCNVKLFLNTVNPEAVFFVRSELWLNYISEIKKREIPLYLLSLSMTPDSQFLNSYFSVLYKDALLSFSHIFCQNIETKELLNNKFGISDISITGNTRIDRVYTIANKAKSISEIEKFVANDFCIIAGSSLPKDELIISNVIDHFAEHSIKWIIVPHEISQQRTRHFQNKHRKCITYSNIKEISPAHNILYVDYVGILPVLYQYGNLAIIGGGFDKIGIHNILEPTVFGIPCAFGPNHRDYPEAIALLERRTAQQFSNENQLIQIIDQLLGGENDISSADHKAYIMENLGATASIYKTLHKIFP